MSILKDLEEGAEVATGGLGIQAKLILGLGAFVLVSIGLEWGAHHYEEKGRKLERAEWLVKEVKEKEADQALILDHQNDMNELEKHHLLLARETSDVHQKETLDLRNKLAVAVRNANDRGGLRIPASSCKTADPAIAGTETTSTSGRDDSGTPTIALPQQIQEDLWSGVNEAEEVSAQLRACQSWIRKNGFYGEPSHDEPTQPTIDPVQ